MSSWLGKPEYNGVKVLLLVVVVAVAGYFVYNSSQQNAVENTGQVAGRNPKNPRNTKVCDDSAPIVGAIIPSFVGGSSANRINLNPGPYPNTNINLGKFRMTNPTGCPMVITKLKFETHPTKMISTPTSAVYYSSLQNLKLFVASTGVQFGPTVNFTSGWDQASLTWLTPADAAASVTFPTPIAVMPVTGTGSTTGTGPSTLPPDPTVLVPAMSYVDFNFVADGQNIPPPAKIRVQLVELNAYNATFPGLVTNMVYPASMPLVQGPVVTYLLP